MDPTAITGVTARKVFDSRGKATVEVEIRTQGGIGRFSSPTGTSKGRYEVMDLPKGGVEEAIKKVDRLLAPKLLGKNSSDQEEIDSVIRDVDGTDNFRNIGGNTAYAASMAAADAAAKSLGKPLFAHLSGDSAKRMPLLLSNMISGGKHALRSRCTIQEFLAIPVGARSFEEVVTSNLRVRELASDFLNKRDPIFQGGMSIEEAWITSLTEEGALECLSEACDRTSDETGVTVKIGVDVAASSFWSDKDEAYVYKDGSKHSSGQHLDFLLDMMGKYPIVYVEDAFQEEDFETFSEMTSKAGDRLICGDDLFVTNFDRLRKGIVRKACNSIIIKPNQVGTLTDTRRTVEEAMRANYVPIASHRSGESCESHLAHVALAFNCPLLKLSVVGGERLIKINELMRLAGSLDMKLARFSLTAK